MKYIVVLATLIFVSTCCTARPAPSAARLRRFIATIQRLDNSGVAKLAEHIGKESSANLQKLRAFAKKRLHAAQSHKLSGNTLIGDGIRVTKENLQQLLAALPAD